MRGGSAWEQTKTLQNHQILWKTFWDMILVPLWKDWNSDDSFIMSLWDSSKDRNSCLHSIRIRGWWILQRYLRKSSFWQNMTLKLCWKANHKAWVKGKVNFTFGCYWWSSLHYKQESLFLDEYISLHYSCHLSQYIFNQETLQKMI